MEQEYIAIISEKLSKPHDTRYILINRETREIVDDGIGRGYKSPQAAHRSFVYKKKFSGKKQVKRSNYPFKQKKTRTTPTSRRITHPQSVSQENTTPPPELFDF